MNKQLLYKNPINNEQWVCDDPKNFKIIDGTKYLQVRKPDSTRYVFLKTDMLVKLPAK